MDGFMAIKQMDPFWFLLLQRRCMQKNRFIPSCSFTDVSKLHVIEDRRNALPKTHYSEHFFMSLHTYTLVCVHPYLPACDLCCVLAALLARWDICALLEVLQAQDGADCWRPPWSPAQHHDSQLCSHTAGEISTQETYCWTGILL